MTSCESPRPLSRALKVVAGVKTSTPGRCSAAAKPVGQARSPLNVRRPVSTLSNDVSGALSHKSKRNTIAALGTTATFADESSGLPKYTSAWRRHLPSKWYIISTPAQFSFTIDGTGADGARSEGGRRILLDNSRVYVRFLPFVSGRVHHIHQNDSEHD